MPISLFLIQWLTLKTINPSKSALIEEYIQKLEPGEALLQDSPQNLLEVVGILKSYGVVLDAYSVNLCYIANTQFLVLFPLSLNISMEKSILVS